MTNFEKQKARDVFVYLMNGNTIQAQGKAWKMNARHFLCYKEGDCFVEQPMWFHKFFALVSDIGKDQWLRIKTGNRQFKLAEKKRLQQFEALYS